MDKKEIILKYINKNEAARYLGYKDTLPDVQITKMLLEAETELLKIIQPRYVYKVFDLYEAEGEILLRGAELKLRGDSIKEHLNGCKKAVVMCATISDKVDNLLRKNELSNMLNALIIDALSNAAIEQVCDEVQEIIENEFSDFYLTWRFGVGYGDFPLSTQKELLETLDAPKRIGVCATDSFILVPRKSVTCIIGLSEKETEQKKSCDNCILNGKCNFRLKGTTCYKQ